ncbi:MAG TPA: hypothetical protein VG433_11310 [Pirellulales bacterium]|jgi:hypothetical protein|nr:hypothetical protein [Pirellulales bacterium]
MNRRVAIVVVLALAISGCTQELDTDYGSRTGMAASSVNGTSVLAEMFKTAGHSISGASWAGPKLAKGADVIVWFPDNMQPPGVKQRRWFENWLCQAPGRTLVYVGRDYDAAISYWNFAIKATTGEQQAAARRELARAEARFSVERLSMPSRENCGWFIASRRLEHRDVHELSGDKQWTSGVDSKRLNIELNGRLLLARRARPLLSSQKDVLVAEKKFCSSKLLVVTNGSFLLNLPLVNHEHRKLAGKLIESIGNKQRVAFLESGAGGLEIFDEDPEPVGRSGLAILVTEPFDLPILHLAVVGIVFCLARFPIFGRPREWKSDDLLDFGAHIAALGKLLAATKDRAFAVAALANYQRAVHAGGSRSRPLVVTPADLQHAALPADAVTPNRSPPPDDGRTA